MSRPAAASVEAPPPLETLLGRLEGVRRSGSGWTALCPAHEDRDPSLGVRVGEDGKLLILCRAGCTLPAIAQALGWTVTELLHGSGGELPLAPGGRRAGSDGSRTADFGREAARAQAALKPDRLLKLAQGLRLAPEAIEELGAGWASRDDLRRLQAGGAGWTDHYPEGAYVFPEQDGSGRIVGLSLRDLEGRKGAPRGARRGLIVPSDFGRSDSPTVVVEGASDVVACLTLGIAAVGRPSNSSGSRDLAKLLQGRKVLVLGERDQKPGGAWPGRDGARKVAGELADAGLSVRWTLPPEGAKDVREELKRRVAACLSLEDRAARKAAGAELLRALRADAQVAPTESNSTRGPSDAELLVRLAEESYRFGLSTDGEPFAVELDGPNVTHSLRGVASLLRRRLAREFRRRWDRTPGASALTDTLTVLAAESDDCEPEPVGLRTARHESGIVVDLGDASGRAVVVTGSGWTIVDRSPVLFRRTALTAELPTPASGGDVDELWRLLRIAPADRPLLLGWLQHAFVPGEPHAILLLGGEQGSAKTTTAEFLVGLIDPSTAPTRTQPRDAKQWAITVAGSACVAFDNLSGISPWLSDALCRAVTGDAWVDRALYSDNELVVLRYQRVLVLTSIDAGALRGDLGDRLLLVDLDRIRPEERRPKRELDERYEAARPRIVGALFDLLARTLAALPGLQVDRLPRMADFCRMLAAADAVLGTDGLGRYLAQSRRVAEDVLEGDPVATACAELAHREGSWSGTAGELLGRITPDPPPRGWPGTPRALSGRLKRAAPTLREVGVELTPPSANARPRRWSLQAVDEARSHGDHSPTVGTVGPTTNGPNGAVKPDPPATDGPTDAPSKANGSADRPTVRRSEPPTDGCEIATHGPTNRGPRRSDDSDGPILSLEGQQPMPGGSDASASGSEPVR